MTWGSSEFGNNLLYHFDDVLSSFGTDFDILAAIWLSNFIRVSNLFIIGLIANYEDRAGSTGFFDFFDPWINVIDWSLVA